MTLGLFQGFGVEVEYMIVDRLTLDVRPISDRLLERLAGEPVSEVERGELAWSNELVLHVIELKTIGPAPVLTGLSSLFHRNVIEANDALASLDAILLPGGAHPWMDPDAEARLWPHENNEVYEAFDRIFSCRGHGWANLQSIHLNLPFQGDDEFRALHSAVRAILPLLPAVAASSPILDGRVQEALDQRMVEYGQNSRRIPSVAGAVVPDAVDTQKDYEREILGPIYRDLALHDPDGTLRHEWVNARGAIARFERDTIELRILDTQECPAADLSVVRAVTGVVNQLCSRILDGDERPHRLGTDELAGVLDLVIRKAEGARLESVRYMEALGLPKAAKVRWARDVWWELLDRAPPVPWEGEGPERDGDGRDPLLTILEEGSLASRIVRSLGPRRDPDELLRGRDRDQLREIYGELADCLARNRVFRRD
ncbi:MAG: glutamate--cysteine ligase [Gemmatimonadetes bacterium]|nr:glutamate--cysteine ligase [Gemmatimonadota bacterium]